MDIEMPSNPRHSLTGPYPRPLTSRRFVSILPKHPTLDTADSSRWECRMRPDVHQLSQSACAETRLVTGKTGRNFFRMRWGRRGHSFSAWFWTRLAHVGSAVGGVSVDI